MKDALKRGSDSGRIPEIQEYGRGDPAGRPVFAFALHKARHRLAPASVYYVNDLSGLLMKPEDRSLDFY